NAQPVEAKISLPTRTNQQRFTAPKQNANTLADVALLSELSDVSANQNRFGFKDRLVDLSVKSSGLLTDQYGLTKESEGTTSRALVYDFGGVDVTIDFQSPQEDIATANGIKEIYTVENQT